MSHFLTVDLPKDLPESWTNDQYVAPEGAHVGLTQQHGYNYLNQQVNRAQAAAAELARILCSGFDNLLDNSYFQDPVDSVGGYCVLMGAKYYRDTALSSSAGTVAVSCVAQYVNETYGTIQVSGTTYYVARPDMYRGYAPNSNTYTFDRWFSSSVAVVHGKSKDGFYLASTNTYVQGLFRQPVMNSHLLAGQTVTLSILVKSITGTSHMTVNTATSADTIMTQELQRKSLKEGLNTLTLTLPSNLGTSSAPYLFIGVTLPVNTVLVIQAVKLQLGEKQTLAYDDGSGAWKLVQMPNRVIEQLKCMGAPVEMGGAGSVFDAAVNTSGTLVDAEVI